MMLFAFCGQVLATPFLKCHGINQVSENVEDMSCHYMMMKSSAHERDDESIESHNHESMMKGLDKKDCDYLCDFCLGVASIHVYESSIYFPIASTSFDIIAYQFFLPSSSLDNPFRPPIIA